MNLECEECGATPIEAFGLCASCNQARRKAERHDKKVKVIKPVKKVSEKKAIELKEYTKLRKDFLSFKNACEIRLPGCFRSSFEIHHCSISEKDFLNTNTWMAICRNCHRKLETEMTAEARRIKGFLTN